MRSDGKITLIRGDARALPLADDSVDLICTSPPYWGLRDYRDGEASLVGQIGAESTPQEYLESLWECTSEWTRVLKPGGSLFVVLGDKYANRTRGAWRGSSDGYTWRADSPRNVRPKDLPEKSLIGLPWRYALGYACACPTPDAPTTPAVVLDPFGGTGTTALVASVLGRHGISVDRSAGYGRIAQWRTTDPGERARAMGVPKPPPVNSDQESLFAEVSDAI